MGIVEPWRVTEATFDAGEGRLDLHIDFARGARFACPESDEDACPVHDTDTKTWRHLDFFQHQAYLHARVPRVFCPAHGVRQVVVPWARPGSGFTLLFEALLVEFAAHMPVAAIALLFAFPAIATWLPDTLFRSGALVASEPLPAQAPMEKFSGYGDSYEQMYQRSLRGGK